MKKYAVIVAGGEGRRMGSPIPKQFVEVAAKPILYHTMKAFHDSDPDTELIVVLHPEFIQDWEEYMSDLPAEEQIPYTAICGGMSRTHSVFNGLSAVSDTTDSLVAIHDAARPVVTDALLQRGWDCAQQHGTAVPVIDEPNSLRKIEPDGNSVSVDRSLYKVVQTPQIFRTSLILSAYEMAGISFDTIGKQGPLHSRFTDDASVAEAAGYPIALYPGDPNNIKVTTPLDLKIFSALLSEKDS